MAGVAAVLLFRHGQHVRDAVPVCSRDAVRGSIVVWFNRSLVAAGICAGAGFAAAVAGRRSVRALGTLVCSAGLVLSALALGASAYASYGCGD